MVKSAGSGVALKLGTPDERILAVEHGEDHSTCEKNLRDALCTERSTRDVVRVVTEQEHAANSTIWEDSIGNSFASRTPTFPPSV